MKKTSFLFVMYLVSANIFFPVFSMTPVSSYPILGEATEWKAIGPPGGNIQSLVYNPQDENEIYALVYNPVYNYAEYLFKTQDGGSSWIRLPLRTGDLADIALDPSDSNIVYAHGKSMYKSFDGGLSWIEYKTGYGKMREMCISPSQTNIIYAVCDSRIPVHKSTDSGETWNQKTSFPSLEHGRCIAVDPFDPDIVYVGADSNKLFKTVDGGTNWEDITGSIMGNPNDIIVDPLDPLKVYIATNGGVFRSGDGGQTWLKNNGNVSAFVLGLDKSQSSIIMAGWDEKIYLSFDAGINWTAISDTKLGECHEILYSTNRILMASTTGIYKSEDTGLTWNDIHTTLSANFILAAAIAPSAQNVIYAVCDRNGLFKTEDYGKKWTRLNDFHRRDYVKQLSIHPNNENDLLFLALSSDIDELYRSEDGGQTWNLIHSGQFSQLAVSRINPDKIYLSGASDLKRENPVVFKSNDRGKTWSTHPISNSVKEYSDAIALDPFNDELVYITVGSSILKSNDGGLNWTDITTPDFGGWGPKGIEINPLDGSEVYFFSYGGIYKSEDFGESWTHIVARYIRDFKIDPLSPNRLFFVGGEARNAIDFSEDSGNTWNDLRNGLFELEDVLFIDLDSTNQILYAGTNVGGIYKFERYDRMVYAPLNVQVQKGIYRSLAPIEILNVITWQTNPKNQDILFYRIYWRHRETGIMELLNELSASTHYLILKDLVHKEEEMVSPDYSFFIVAVDKDGRESNPEYFRIW